MSQENAALKAVSDEANQQPAEPIMAEHVPVQAAPIVASLRLSRAADGAIGFVCSGHDCDLLGLAEYAKFLIKDRARNNIQLAAAKAAAEQQQDQSSESV